MVMRALTGSMTTGALPFSSRMLSASTFMPVLRARAIAVTIRLPDVEISLSFSCAHTQA
jgi:hypothetical protein